MQCFSFNGGVLSPHIPTQEVVSGGRVRWHLPLGPDHRVWAPWPGPIERATPRKGPRGVCLVREDPTEPLGEALLLLQTPNIPGLAYRWTGGRCPTGGYFPLGAEPEAQLLAKDGPGKDWLLLLEVGATLHLEVFPLQSHQWLWWDGLDLRLEEPEV